MTDRLDALTMQRAEPTATSTCAGHGLQHGAGDHRRSLPRTRTCSVPRCSRSIDFLRAELPDVFYFPQSSDPDYNSLYPINFGMHQFPTASGSTFNFVLPLGCHSRCGLAVVIGTGMNGASYLAAGGLYKNLGQVPQNFMPTGVSGMQPVQPRATTGSTTAASRGSSTTSPRAPTRPTAISRPSTRRRPTTRTRRRGRRCSTRCWSKPEARSAASSTPTTSPTARSRTPTTTACPSSSMPGASRSTSTAGRSTSRPTSRRGSTHDALSVFETREQNPLDPSQQLLAPAWW